MIGSKVTGILSGGLQIEHINVLLSRGQGLVYWVMWINWSLLGANSYSWGMHQREQYQRSKELPPEIPMYM